MSRWLQAEYKYTGKVLFDFLDKKITRDDPNFMEALKEVIEYKGLERAHELIDDGIATQEEVSQAITELNKRNMEDKHV